MDDKILFYIVLGIIYFLFNRLKKKKPAEESENDTDDNTQPENGPRPVSFEELLREITEAKQKPTYQPPVVARNTEFETLKPQPAYVDYDDDLSDEEESLEKIDDERSNKVFEEAKALAFNRPSLEDTLELKDVNTEYGKFKQFETKTESSVLSAYMKELRDPKGFKKALILSEVLNRKHF